MTKISNLFNQKALILTGFNEELYPLFPVITQKKTEELLVLHSFGKVISQPYGCLIRDIILAVYSENVEEIYIIEENNKKSL
jgi:carbonic anhydrase